MRRHHTLFRAALAVLAFALLCALVIAPVLALARAGGGQIGGGFSGGGFSGGGGGFSGGSGGGLAVIPFIGGSGDGCGGTIGIIVVVIIVLFVLSRMKGAGKGGGGGMPFNAGAAPGGPAWTPGAPAMPAGDPYAQIKAADPGFSEDFFYGRVNEMFIAIQYAWMNRNMEPVRRFLADQQFTVLQAGVQELVLKGRINMLESIHIVHIDPVQVSRESDYDSVKLAITAACIDYTIDERTKEIVNPHELGDGKTPSQFVEHWTFVRKSGAVSKPDQSIQKCPNCGAPVTDGNYVKCAYCGVMMNDPTLDWVLMRIEQV
jgi:predicted lipid-binding transport protein (Tim44 family)